MFNLPNLDFLQNPEWEEYIQDLMAGNPGVNPLAGGGGVARATLLCQQILLRWMALDIQGHLQSRM